MQLIPLAAHDTLSSTNLYADELINFLHIWLTLETLPTAPQQFTFRFDTRHNQLAEIVPSGGQAGFRLHLVLFEGRQEAMYSFRAPMRAFLPSCWPKPSK